MLLNVFLLILVRCRRPTILELCNCRPFKICMRIMPMMMMMLMMMSVQFSRVLLSIVLVQNSPSWNDLIRHLFVSKQSGFG